MIAFVATLPAIDAAVIGLDVSSLDPVNGLRVA